MLHHLIQTREFPVDDTTAIARSDTDETATLRVELGAISTGTGRVWTVPDQNLDFTPDSGDFGASGSSLPVADTTAIVKDPSTATKRMRIDVGAVSADTTRVLTMPDANVDLTVGSGTFNKYVHPDHTGDVTSSADGDQTIAADAVTYAKMQNVTGTDKFLGRDSSGAGIVEEISASSARTILNVEDGADVTDTANVNSAAATTVGTVTSGVWSATDVAVAAGGTGASSASAARTNLGVAIGSNVQAFGAVLDDFNSLGAVSSDGQIIVGTGSGAFAYESGATARTSLGLTIGTHVQAWDNDLDDIAALTPTKGKIFVGNGSDWINLSVGDDDQVLTADADEASGTKWAAAGGGGADIQYITSSGDWTKPASGEVTIVQLYGGGGGGGGGGAHDDEASGWAQGAGGGGGGAYAEKIFNTDDLGSTVAVTIGAGGTAGDGKEDDSIGLSGEMAGGQGGNSTFAAHLTAYGGAPGAYDHTNKSGGGGGLASAGSNNDGGGPLLETNSGASSESDMVTEYFGGGMGRDTTSEADGFSSIYGGGGGGSASNDTTNNGGKGASSLYGGAGGGGSTRQSGGAHAGAGGVGGKTGTLAVGGGGTAGAADGGAGGAGSAKGMGGGGGGSSNDKAGGAGGNGGLAAGGGGGGAGGGAGNSGGNGGVGGAGFCVVYTL